MKKVILRDGDIVRSWLNNLRKESNGEPLRIIVGSKVIEADGIFLNIAHAVDIARNKKHSKV